jgi:hypothetical protein
MGKALAEKRRVQRAIDLAAEHARAYQRMGVHIRRAQRLTGMARDINALACFESRQWTTLDGHFIAEHPGMSSLHAALLAAAQIQIWKTHELYSK